MSVFAQLFLFGVTIVSLGWLWFFIARPILVDWGWLIVDENGEIMSRRETSQALVAPSVPHQDALDGQTDDAAPVQTALQTPVPLAIMRDDKLKVYRSLRAHSYSRDEARELLSVLRAPLDNNLWSEAKPEPTPAPVEDDTLVTPWAGRRTKASYYPDDPALEYQQPA